MAASIFSQRVLAVSGNDQQAIGHRHATTADCAMHGSVPEGPPQQIAMLIYPEFTAQDLIGPHTFLASLMNVQVHLVWKDKRPVALDRGGASLNPTTTFAECPRDLDVLFAPGGLRGTVAAMRDPEVLEFLSDRGKRAKYVTSVCTGSLLLGCAGLLRGYRATSHWATRDLLPLLGATPIAQRVVEDRNRITGAGVTSGIDFGLVLAARMRDERFAKMLQLANEYDPQPPFHAGSPKAAGPEIVEHLRRMLAPGIEEASAAARSASKQFKNAKAVHTHSDRKSSTC
jgi:cyclohexyl-isocyanide hydratase